MDSTIQGHIWRTGFENNELEGVVFDDVPEALQKWHSFGTKVLTSSFVDTALTYVFLLFSY